MPSSKTDTNAVIVIMSFSFPLQNLKCRLSCPQVPWIPDRLPGGVPVGSVTEKKQKKTEEARAQSNIYTAYRWGFFLRLRSLLAQVPDHWGTFIPETSDASPSTVATLQQMIKFTVSDMARFFCAAECAALSQKRSGFPFNLWLMVQFFFFYLVGPVRCSEKNKGLDESYVR